MALATTKGTKAEILKFGSSGSAGPAPVEVLNAFANYFKHESEWRRTDWSKLTGQALGTATVIQAAGASPGSTGNLRSGFEHLLGHHDYERVVELANLVSGWKVDLLKAYRAEVKSVGLI